MITKVLLKDCKKWKSFEFLLCKANLKGFILNLVNVYHPPYSAKNKFTISDFFKDFEDFLSAIAPLPGDLLLFGDLNLHLELLTDSNTSNFYNLLKQFSLEQLIKSATHIKGGILDLIIKSNALKISGQAHVDYEFQTDHHPIPEVGKLWPTGQMWPAKRFLWPAAHPRTQSTLLDFFR